MDKADAGARRPWSLEQPIDLMRLLPTWELEYLDSRVIQDADSKGEKAIAELGEIVGQGGELAAAQATCLAARLGSPAALAIIEAAASHRYDYVRLSAAGALAEMSWRGDEVDERIRAIAERLSKDPNERVAMTASQTWASRRGRDATKEERKK